VKLLWLPFACAAMLAATLSLACRTLDPFHFRAKLSGIISDDAISRFLTAWWVHMGAYIGLFTGVISGIVLTRGKQRHGSILGQSQERGQA